MSKLKFKGAPVHTNSEPPALGSPAPDFTLTDANLRDYPLSEFSGKKKLLSIVPSLDTPTCATTTKKFNEIAKRYPDTRFIIVSRDLPFAQKRLCDHENLKNIVTLSTFRSEDFSKKYGVLIMDGPLQGLTARAVIIIDEQDRILYTELVEEISNEPDYERAAKLLS